MFHILDYFSNVDNPVPTVAAPQINIPVFISLHFKKANFLGCLGNILDGVTKKSNY